MPVTPRNLAGCSPIGTSPAKIAGVLLLVVCGGLGTAVASATESTPTPGHLLVEETLLLEQLLAVRQRLADLESPAVVPVGRARGRQQDGAAVTSSRSEQVAHLRSRLRSLEIRLLLQLRKRAAALEPDLAVVRTTDQLVGIATVLRRFAEELAKSDAPKAADLVDELSDLARAAAGLSTDRGAPPVRAPSTSRQAYGWVTDEVTGQPLGGMTVRFSNSLLKDVQEAQTNPDGYYEQVALGDYILYEVTVEDPGGEYLNTTPWDLRKVIWIPTPDPTPRPPVAKRLDFTMRRGGRITGTVRDERTSLPLAGAKVRTVDHTLLILGTVTTESDGTYTTRRFRPQTDPPGAVQIPYRLRAFRQQYHTEVYENQDKEENILLGQPVPVNWGQVTSDIDFTLLPSFDLEGTVTKLLGGAALAGVVCEVWRVVPAPATIQSFTWVTWSETGEDGKCHTGQLEGQDSAPSDINYRVVTWDPGRSKSEIYDDQLCSGWSCDLGTGTDLPAVNGTTTTYQVSLEEGGCIAGAVTAAASGAPIEGANVCTYTGDPGTVFIGCSSTAADGTYRHCGHDTGSYYAAADDPSFIYLPGLYDDLPCPAPCIPPPPTGTPISVTDGATVSGIDFALDRAASISGTVTSAGGAGFVPQVAISAWPPSGPWVASATPAPDGSYLLPGLATGSYWVTTQDVSGGWDGEVWDDHPCNSCDPPATGDAIATTLGSDTGGIDFELDGLGTISGTVREVGTGAGIPGIEVEVYDSSGTLVDSPTTGADGGYMTTDLPVALYTALAVDPGGTYPSELFAQQPCDGCDPTTGAELAVFPGVDNFGVDFTLNPAPGGCADEVTISNTTVDAVVEYEACERLIFGPAFNAEWPALGLALAGESIEIGNGTSIGEGARFTFLTHPDLFP